jgi:hypothetical protein
MAEYIELPEFAVKGEAELPAPSAELVLWRTSVQAFIAVCGKRKAEKFLRIMSERLAHEDNLSSVFQIRPVSEQAAVRVARRQAAVVFDRYLPLFLAGMPDE